ncbi:hypothetical protein [Actinomadura madurae]|uniref:hypothetical protein n=1 Tax=Actinomadura madurae TaxID=1993 RepID=UPI0020D22C7F|nr:hypothetical protein [Actinomadura madurae]MCP9965901.1 hypothetical protein [Actinomadura madurae]MCP9978376.1 hypothetical protein [Actinomadura madurae]MCQ0014584.1 hypothetical protein [Actinomadura madurae]
MSGANPCGVTLFRRARGRPPSPRLVLARLLPAGRRRDRAADAAVVLAGVALSVQTVIDPGAIVHRHGGASVALFLVPAAALALRRRAPMAVAWLTVGFAVLVWLLELAAPGALLRVDADHTLSPVVWWPPTAPLAAYAVAAFPRDGGRRPGSACCRSPCCSSRSACWRTSSPTRPCGTSTPRRPTASTRWCSAASPS